jgi:alpha-L-rhamnosidase
MPFALGLVEPEEREDVIARMITNIRQHDDHVTAGDVGFPFVVKALADAGRSDVIYDVLSRTDPPSYGAQLQRGATALTEAWDANPAKSQNHLMLGHADSWFFEHLAGIQFDLSRPPSDRITIRPSPVGDVTWARASYDSVLGPISSHWERQAQMIRLIVSIPPNATGLVYVPTSDAASVRERGGSIERAAGVRLVRATSDAAVCEVGSGRYVFEATYGASRKG